MAGITPYKLNASNPLVYNPLTLPIPLIGSLFGGGGDKNHTNEKLAAYVTGDLPAYSGDAPLDPTTGTPLPDSAAPQWGGAGGGEQAAKVYAWADFKNMFGRNPTQQELTQLYPSYISGDPNIANRRGGQAALSDYYSQLANSPTNLYNQQQKQLTAKAPQFYDQVSQLFQGSLGRDATDAEKTHFGMLMASGQDPYEIQQALQQTTEYQNKQTQDFTNQLKGQLQGTNADYFSKYILPSIQSQNAMAGRTQDSSGYQAQLANAAQQQNYDLQNYLAQVSAQAYGNSTANAAANYEQLLNQQYGLSNANVSNALSQQASNQNWQRQLQLYNMQQQAYNNYLNNYGKRSGMQGLGSLAGGIGGAFLGSSGGPQGALAGYQAGSGIGGALGAFL